MDAHSTVQHNDDDSSPAGQKRQRAKQACEPCRLRKRRCDGSMPCNMCKQFEYSCFFEKHPRKRSKLVEQNAHLENSKAYIRPTDQVENRPSVEEMSKMRSMEANSGIAFTRLLGQRLDPSSGPKLFTFGWNLGSAAYLPPATRPITDLVDQEQMLRLADLYFENIHPLYGFLDEDWISNQIGVRWTKPSACTAPDHLLANIAAAGSVFAAGQSTPRVIEDLVASARAALESSLMLPPNLHHVQSWLVRCLYLRVVDHPHAVHMTSTIIMHLVEALGLHQELTSSVLHPPAYDQTYDAETRRRTFWVARLMNTWVSFEYGRTRVALRGIDCELPTPRDQDDFTVDYINLYSLSCELDPERSDGKWEEFMRRIEAYEPPHDGIELSRANLGMCGYRRLRLANPNLTSDTINRIIQIGLKGLAAARRMAEKGKPWWHVANVPFQVICVFLAMDVKESLVHLPAALRVLEDVTDRFQTAAMKEALKTARFLVRLSKKRKDEDSEILALSLQKGVVDEDPQPRNLDPQPQSQLVNGNGIVAGATDGTPMTVSSEDWSTDLLNNSNFDWNFFLTAEMPAFNSIAPDGAM